MKLVAGLGNPGPKYETTPHNVSFLAVDRLIDRWKATGPQTKFHSELYQAEVDSEKVFLLKPQTYMNLSGKAVAAALSFYQLMSSDLIVIHDELDLDPGIFRLKKGGGTAGHKGLKSIQELLPVEKGKTDFYRVRIGIGHPSRPVQVGGQPEKLGRMSPADYVLRPYSDQELKDLDPFLDDVAEAVEMLLKGQMDAAMMRFHQTK